MKPLQVFIGWDASQMRAFNVAQASARMVSSVEVQIHQINLSHLRSCGAYTRLTEQTPTGYWDAISAAPMSTGHAIARFLVPHLTAYRGWALFTDGDVLFRRDLAQLFALAQEEYAVQVVQHPPLTATGRKMEGAEQTQYARKNWSSVVLFNCGHPSNRKLDLDLVNRLPGRDLHRFCWLEDDEVGALPPEWNYLVNVSPKQTNPAIVHFTEGVPDMHGYEHVEYADEWYAIAKGCGYHLRRPQAPETAF